MSDVEGLAEDRARGEQVAPWLVLFSQHLPLAISVLGETSVRCSCGNPLYVGHLVGLIADKEAAHIQAARAEAFDEGFAAGDAGFGSAATPDPYRAAALRADDAGGE